MRWVTRAGMHVDRTACAWLIRSFIDPDAEFVFATDLDDLPADATPFDIAGYPFSHRDGDCTFEVLLRDHGLTDPALTLLGRIVHEADLEDERYDAPEAPGLDAIIDGMGRLLDDDALLTSSGPIYDGLFATIRSGTVGDRP
jgi:hypothetical protein